MLDHSITNLDHAIDHPGSFQTFRERIRRKDLTKDTVNSYYQYITFIGFQGSTPQDFVSFLYYNFFYAKCCL